LAKHVSVVITPFVQADGLIWQSRFARSPDNSRVGVDTQASLPPSGPNIAATHHSGSFSPETLPRGPKMP
jgi:hypothetical protein